MNKGIKLATGDVIGTLNADDFYTTPNVLARVAAVFEDPAVMSCYGNLEYVRETRGGNGSDSPAGFAVVRHWQSGAFKRDKFKWGWMPPHPTFFVRRSVYERFGLFRLDMGSAADYELMLRLLFRHRITAAYIPEVLVRMRAGGVSNASLANRLRANRMDRLAWAVNGLGTVPVDADAEAAAEAAAVFGVGKRMRFLASLRLAFSVIATTIPRCQLDPPPLSSRPEGEISCSRHPPQERYPRQHEISRCASK